MPIEREKRAITYLSLAALFLIIHLAYYQTGLRFDSEPLYLNWQFLDIYLLRNRLFESLLYFHAQPPLFNLITGLVLQLSPDKYELAFYLIFLLLGFCLYLSLFLALRLAGCSTFISILASTLFCITPSFMLYEHTLFYPLPVALILVLAALMLYRFAAGGGLAIGVFFFFLVFLLNAISTQFQLPYFLLTVALLLTALKPRSKVLLAAALPLVLALGLYAKNRLIFGKFSTSTWLGMNLMHNLAEAIPLEERRRLVESGALSQAMLAPPFSPLEAYPFLPPLPARFAGIKALSQTEKQYSLPHPDKRMRVNFNHYSYIQISDLYLRDFMRVARHFPQVLLKRHDGSWQRYFTPSTFRAVSGDNLSLLAPVIRFFDRYVYLKLELGPPVGPQQTPRQIFLTLLAGLPLLFGYGLHLVLARRTGGGIQPQDKPRRLMLGFMLLTIAYLTIVGNIIECGENNRFRFALDPFFFVVLGAAGQSFFDKLHRTKRPSP